MQDTILLSFIGIISFPGLRPGTYVPGCGTNIYGLIIAEKPPFGNTRQQEKMGIFSAYLIWVRVIADKTPGTDPTF